MCVVFPYICLFPSFSYSGATERIGDLCFESRSSRTRHVVGLLFVLGVGRSSREIKVPLKHG